MIQQARFWVSDLHLACMRDPKLTQLPGKGECLLVRHLERICQALTTHPARAEYIKHLTVTVPSTSGEHSAHLLSLLEQVERHIQRLDLHLAPSAIARVEDQQHVIEGYMDFMEELKARIPRWEKLVELKLVVVAGRSLKDIDHFLRLSPRLQSLVLRPVNIVCPRSATLATNVQGLVLVNLKSIVVSPLLPPTPASPIHLPPGAAGVAFGPLRQAYREIETAILGRAPNLERLAVGHHHPFTPSDLKRMVDRAQKMKVLYVEIGSPAGREQLSPICTSIEILGLGLPYIPDPLPCPWQAVYQVSNGWI